MNWTTIRQKVGYLWIPAAYMCFYLPTFFWLDNTVKPEILIHSNLDALIPFNEWFVIPYCLWFLVIPGSALLLHWLDKRAFFDCCFVMYVGMTICLFIYWRWPNMIELRQPLEITNPAAAVVAFLRQADTPYNVCPSIHCSTSFAFAWALFRSKAVKQRIPRLRVAGIVLCLMISVSTLFIKQHSVVDVFWGFMLTVALYCVTAVYHRLRDRRAATL